MHFGYILLCCSAVFIIINEQAEFPGGILQLYQYLNPELSQIFSNSDLWLQGRYIVRFEVMENGKTRYISAEGVNVADIENQLKHLIEKMEPWKISKRNGKPVAATMRLKIDVL